MNQIPNYLGDAVDFSSIRRVLVVKLRHHGDVLLSSPLFRVLKNHHPHLDIDALVYHDTREMLTLHPDIRCVHTIDRNWKKLGLLEQLRHERALMSELKERRYDLLIHLTEHWRGALLSRRLQPRYSVTASIPKVQQTRGQLWKKSFPHHYPVALSGRHTVETHLDALRRLGLQPDDDERRLILVPGEAADAHIDGLLKEHGIDDFIHIHPTSRWLFKCWREDKVAEIINRLVADGKKVVITAAPAEREMRMVQDILGYVESGGKDTIIDLSGQLNLKELAALTTRAELFFGMDSVPMHIAAAVGTPCVALFGPSNPVLWGPWQVEHRVIQSANHSCRPCGIDGCGGGKVSECLTTLDVPQVFDAICTLIPKPSPE